MTAVDNGIAYFGTGLDLRIFHDGSNSKIVESGTGSLIIQTSNFNLDNAGGTENILTATENGAVELYYDNVKRLETLSNGVRVVNQLSTSESVINLEKAGCHHHRIVGNDTGNDLGFQQSSDLGSNTNFTTYLRINDGGNISLPVDNQKLRLGASADLQIYHDGSHSYIEDSGTGVLHIATSSLQVVNAAKNEFMMNMAENGAVELYHDGNKKLNTHPNGIFVQGIYPMADNTYNIGSSTQRFINIYATSGTVNTSDKNVKNTIVNSDLGLDFINKLNPVSYKWNEDDGKTHYGLIAQDVEETLTSIGKTISDFGGLYKKDTSPMGLGYSELIAPLIKAVQELSAKVAALEAA